MRLFVFIIALALSLSGYHAARQVFGHAAAGHGSVAAAVQASPCHDGHTGKAPADVASACKACCAALACAVPVTAPAVILSPGSVIFTENDRVFTGIKTGLFRPPWPVA